MTTITRRFEWDSGHRVLGHEGKCRHLHGHRYVAEITVWAGGLDSLGRVIDFGEIKRIVGKWIDDRWDHNLLLNAKDPLLTAVEECRCFDCPQDEILGGKEPYIMEHGNPTAEVMAEDLFKTVCSLLPSYLVVKKVKLYETPNCYAEYPSE